MVNEQRARRARRATTSSAQRRRRLQRLERRAHRRRNPLASLVLLAAGLLGVFAIVAALAVATGRLPMQAAEFAGAGQLRSAPVQTPGTDGELVVRVIAGPGRPEVAGQIDRLAGPAGFRTRAAESDGEDHDRTRILVHHDDPSVVAAAADLRDVLGLGVIERGAEAPDGADLTVIVGTDFPPADPA